MEQILTLILLDGYWDIVYANNHYFIFEETGLILIKAIDAQEEIIWIEANLSLIKSPYCIGRQLQVAFDERAIVGVAPHGVTYYYKIGPKGQLLKKFRLSLPDENGIIHHKVFGEKKDYLAYLTKNRVIYIYSVNFENETGTFCCKEEITTSAGSNLVGISLAVCPKNRFLVVEDSRELKVNNFYILEFKERKSLVHKGYVSLGEANLSLAMSLDFFGYFGDHLLVCGITKGSARVLVFDYDLRNERVKQIMESDERCNLRTGNCYKFNRVGDSLVTSCTQLKMISLRLKYQEE